MLQFQGKIKMTLLKNVKQKGAESMQILHNLKIHFAEKWRKSATFSAESTHFHLFITFQQQDISPEK